MIRLFSLSVLLASVIGAAAAAERLRLEGKFSQGGLIQGHTEPGTRLFLGNRQIRVDGNGRFVFGFGRNAPKTVRLVAEFPDGARNERALNVAQRKYRIQWINGLPRKMVTPSKSALKRIRTEGAAIRAARATFSADTNFADGFIWPARGRISGVYGSQRILNGEPRRPHLGVDIAAPSGTPVIAAATGVVTLAEPDLYFTGGTVIIHHGHGLSTVYSHLISLSVKKGDKVDKGQRIAKVGSTGRSTGPHLDWRINWFQERLDPMLIVGPMPKNRPQSGRVGFFPQRR